MNSLIIYDSMFGNTEKIARAVGAGLPNTNILRVSDTKLSDLNNVDILIVGSPTQGGRATQTIQNFINSIPADGLKNVRVTAFDTRFAIKDHGLFLRIVMKTIAYAAEKIEKILVSKGGIKSIPPEGFIVTGKEGPLKEGELERATAWAKKIQST